MDPSNSQHVNKSLHIGGMQIPRQPLQPRFTGASELHVNSFHALFKAQVYISVGKDQA